MGAGTVRADVVGARITVVAAMNSAGATLAFAAFSVATFAGAERLAGWTANPFEALLARWTAYTRAAGFVANTAVPFAAIRTAGAAILIVTALSHWVLETAS